MPNIELTRRRFITIAAAATAIGSPRAVSASTRLHEWRGTALGAQATIRLAHPEESAARALLRRCVMEIERLERILSLYLPDSAVCRLNEAGVLDAPPVEFVELLGRAAAVSAATDGVFDVTVQPLWQRYAKHFASAEDDTAGPDVEDVLPLIDWRNVSIAADRIAFRKAGMAVTLNGIAQGYITDRIADMLRAEGMGSVLIDLGEIRSLGAHPAGHPWRVGIADPARPERIAARLDLTDLALATSGGYGMRFEPSGRHNHLLDPRTGRSAPALRSVSVIAQDATTADAGSTALSLVDTSEMRHMLERLGAFEAHVLGPDGWTIIRSSLAGKWQARLGRQRV